MSKLTPDAVTDLFRDCLYTDDEWSEGDPQPEDVIEVEGIVGNYGFNPERLESHRADVAELLDELQDQFKATSGGGWSFLNVCEDKHGNLWTGEHRVCGMLMGLGMGLGLVSCQMPREMWSVLPGGMPYYVVNDREPVTTPSEGRTP